MPDCRPSDLEALRSLAEAAGQAVLGVYRRDFQQWTKADQSPLTEADLRLWTTLVRFDAVYATHFKCDRKRIRDYPNLDGLLRDIYQLSGVADTVWMDHIRHHYFRSHKSINPYGIVSIGPAPAFDAPHDRERLGEREIRGA